MEITKEMIEEWRAVCEAATPGGWTTAVIIGEQYKCAVASKIGLVALDVRRSDDSAFIAAARTALPAALDEIDRLQGDCKKIARVYAQTRRQFLDLAAENADLCEQVARLTADIEAARKESA